MADQDATHQTDDPAPLAVPAEADLDDDDGIEDLEFLVDDIEDQIAPLAR